MKQYFTGQSRRIFELHSRMNVNKELEKGGHMNITCKQYVGYVVTPRLTKLA